MSDQNHFPHPGNSSKYLTNDPALAGKEDIVRDLSEEAPVPLPQQETDTPLYIDDEDWLWNDTVYADIKVSAGWIPEDNKQCQAYRWGLYLRSRSVPLRHGDFRKPNT